MERNATLASEKPTLRPQDLAQRGESMRNDRSKRAKFILEPFEDIKPEVKREWLVKRILPRRGVVALYGASQSFKSFAASDLALHVALGWEWAGRRVVKVPAVYIAAEGAAGLRKRKIGFELAHTDQLPSKVQFYLISAAPNLGSEQGDLKELVAAIEAAGVAPGLIVIDTLAQSIGNGDENGAGMIQFVANATALAIHFKACVVVVHHVGLNDPRRMRGHSSLLGGVDVQILAERKEGNLSTTLTLQKERDEASDIKMTAHLSRLVIAEDEDGEEVSTLVVDRIEEGADAPAGKRSKMVAASQQLLLDVVTEALTTAKERIFPYGSIDAFVDAVPESEARGRYYARMAERADPAENKNTLKERQKKAFKRATSLAVQSGLLMEYQQDGNRFLWLSKP